MTKNWFRGRRSLEFMLHTKSVQNAMKKYTHVHCIAILRGKGHMVHD